MSQGTGGFVPVFQPGLPTRCSCPHIKASQSYWHADGRSVLRLQLLSQAFTGEEQNKRSGEALLKSCSMESLSIWYLRWFCRSWNLAPMWKFAKYSIRPNFAENVRESVDCVTIVSRLCYDCVDVVAVISVYRKPTGLTAPWTFVTRTARAPTCHWHRRRWSGHGHSTRASKATEKADVQSIDDFDTIWKLMSPEAKKFTPLSQVMSVMSSM